MFDLNPKRAEKELEGIILILDTHIADAQSVLLYLVCKNVQKIIRKENSVSTESKLNERNYGISLLKILATIIVCLLHHSRLYSNGIFGGGNVATEMFFMIAGFYLARKAEREHANPLEAARRETITRLKRFMPYVLLAFIIYYPLARIYNIDNLTYITENEVLTQVFYLCGLGMLGYYADGTYPIGNMWYIYCLLIAVLIIYPLLVKTMKKTLDVGIYTLLAAFILYGFLFQRYRMVQCDAVVSIDNVIFAYPCIIRAVAGILLGVFIYSVSARTAGTKKLTLLGKGVMWGIELGMLAFETGYIMQKKAFSKWDFISIILFMLILLIAFCYKIEIKSPVLKK